MKAQNYKSHSRYYYPHHFIFYPIVFGLFILSMLGYIKSHEHKIEFALLAALMFLVGWLSFMMRQGTVKFFNETKGFGFITPSNGGSEIFVHSSGLIDNIRENDTVSYDVEQGKKGLNAVNVKVS